MTSFYQWQNDELILKIRVQPRSSQEGFAEIVGDSIKLRIKAAPVDGKANQHLISWLAKTFKVSKQQVSILSGESSRNKRVKIHKPGQLPDAIHLA